MIGRNKRGIRRASTRVRVAVAAAVLVGGGAAAAVGIAASNHGTVDAASAGYYTHHSLSEQHAMSDAMGWWQKSPSTSLSLISQMQPMKNVSTTTWHSHTLVLQRGTVLGETRNEFAIKSSNNQLEIWHVNGGTGILNVGGTSMGMNAMTGGGSMMQMPSHMRWNMGARKLAAGDFVFIFGEKSHGELVAQLVLFVAPTTTVTPTTTPTATPTMTATPTATPTTTATPTATATGATSTTPNTTINGTPAVSGTRS